jgi:hypothetical protein
VCGKSNEEVECHSKLWSGNPKGRHHLEVVEIDGRMILKCVLKKQWECGEQAYELQIARGHYTTNALYVSASDAIVRRISANGVFKL